MNKRKRGLIFEYYLPVNEKERRELILACPLDVQFLLLEHTMVAHLKKKRVYRIIQVIQEFKSIWLVLKARKDEDERTIRRYACFVQFLYKHLAKHISSKPCIITKHIDGKLWFGAFRALYKHINKQYCIFKLANKFPFLMTSLFDYLLLEEAPKPIQTAIHSGTYIDYVYNSMLRFRIMKMPKKDGKYALMKYCLPNLMAMLIDHKEFFAFIYLVDSQK